MSHNNCYHFFLFIYFNRRIITSQYCDGLCHTSTQIVHRHACVPSLLNPVSLLPAHLIPLDCYRAPTLCSLHHTSNSHWLSIFTYGSIYVSMLFSQIVLPSPPPTVSPSLFFMSVSPLLPCTYHWWYSLSRFCIYALVQNICLSTSDLLHSL